MKKDAILAKAAQQREAALRGAEGDLDAAKTAADAAQNALKHARQVSCRRASCNATDV